VRLPVGSRLLPWQPAGEHRPTRFPALQGWPSICRPRRCRRFAWRDDLARHRRAMVDKGGSPLRPRRLHDHVGSDGAPHLYRGDRCRLL